MSAVADIRPGTLDGALALERRWVPWREELVGGRKVKRPYTPDGTAFAAVDNPATWGTRAEAELGAQGFGGGIGIILGAYRTCVGGIDLDTCLDDAGELEPWAQAIVAALPTYWEISVNGAGLHALFRYRAEDSERLKAALKAHGSAHNRASDKPHKPGCATYVTGRYFTLSQNLFPGSAETIRELSADQLVHVIERLAPAVAGRADQRRPPDESRSGRAWRLAIKTVAFGKGKRSFINALYDDPDLAEWAEENSPYNETRCWERAVAGFGWMADCKRQRNGTLIGNLDNTLQYLRHAPELSGLFGYDDMARVEMLLKAEWGGPRPLRDTDATAVQEWMQEHWLISAGKDTVFQAIALVARERSYHPVRDYLKRLDWDGTDRLDTWLAVYCEADYSPYTAAVGRMFLMQMVARIFRPGCKADHMLILEGTQGTAKSTALNILAGEWFSDSLPDVRTSANHDVSLHLNGKWLIEIAEMSAMDKADAAALKSFLTRRIEQYRPSYGRKEVYEPRQCSFVGTTNKTAYLRDETGGRRYWPVTTEAIDLDRLKRDRDQLFAEAVARVQRGEPWWPDQSFEMVQVRPQQEARYEADPWEQTVTGYLEKHPSTTVRDVARSLFIMEAQLGTRDTRRITAILERAGYQRRQDKHGRRHWIDPTFL